MKRILIFMGVLALLASPFTSCQRSEPTPSVGGQPLQLSSARFGTESSEFAFEFFKTLLASEKPDVNVVTSPLSLHIALGMLLNGAEGQTADELLAALRLKGYSPEQYNEVYRQLVDGLPKVDNQVDVRIANSVWYRQNLSIEAPFIEALKTTFAAEVKPLTADPSPINRWVSEKTAGKIDKLMDQVDADLAMLLINAVYFKGDWKYQFKESDTFDGPFAYPDGRKNRVPTMSQKGTFRNAFTDNYAAVELPYSNGNYVMTVILPTKTDVTAFAKTFDAAAWSGLQSQLHESNLIVKIPRFEASYEYKPNLNATLQKMGIQAAFVEGLTKIRKQNDLSVGQVIQKAYIKTDEKGSEAAAVTSVEVVLTSAPLDPPTFYADRPFLFFISEKTANTVLFAGRVSVP